MLGVALLVACSDGVDSNGESAERSNTGSVDGPVLVSPASKTNDGMGAEVRGEVSLDTVTGCMRLEYEGAEYPVVWPHGTAWQPAKSAVVLASGEVVPIGTPVHGGGGYLYRDNVERMAGSEVADAATACAGPTGEIALFNLGSVVTVGSR
jgi:hypothetical protein